MNHQAKLQQLVNLSKGNKLHHALLFTGCDQKLLENMALVIAKAILCSTNNNQLTTENYCSSCHSCNLFAAQTHPDYLTSSDFELETTSKIKVDTIRKINEFVANKPQIDTNKVVLISSASKLNIQASNALLKTLEEPISNTTLILLAKNKGELLDTIASRCLEINIPDGSESSIPSLQKELVSDFISDLSSLIVNKTTNVVELAEKWDNLAKSNDCISYIYQAFATIIIMKFRQDRPSLNIPNSKLFRSLNSLVEFKRVAKLGQNPNFQLFLMGLLTKLTLDN